MEFKFNIPDIHIGDSLRKWLKTHCITRQQFADAMGLPKSNIDRILFNPTIDTDKLIRISKVLQVNFFEEFWSDSVVDEFGNTLQSIHIGQKIEMYMKSVDMSQAKMAELLGLQQPVISKILNRQSIDSGKLTEISRILEHNFFLDFYGNIEETATDLAVKAGYYMGKYNKLIIDYERVSRELLDCKAEVDRLKRKLKEMGCEDY